MNNIRSLCVVVQSWKQCHTREKLDGQAFPSCQSSHSCQLGSTCSLSKSHGTTYHTTPLGDKYKRVFYTFLVMVFTVSTSPLSKASGGHPSLIMSFWVSHLSIQKARPSSLHFLTWKLNREPHFESPWSLHWLSQCATTTSSPHPCSLPTTSTSCPWSSLMGSGPRGLTPMDCIIQIPSPSGFQ